MKNIRTIIGGHNATQIRNNLNLQSTKYHPGLIPKIYAYLHITTPKSQLRSHVQASFNWPIRSAVSQSQTVNSSLVTTGHARHHLVHTALSLKHVDNIFCINEQANILGVTVSTVQVYTVHMFSKPVRASEAGSLRA